MASPSASPSTLRGPVTATAQARKRRPFLFDLYSTALGKKYAMAISGIAMMGFVLFHMIGNLKMYQGSGAERLCRVPQATALSAGTQGGRVVGLARAFARDVGVAPALGVVTDQAESTRQGRALSGSA